MKTVCAFANDLDNWGGGYIVIGVEEEKGRPGGETRPYSSPKTMNKDNKERIHYIRKSSNSAEPTDDEEKDLFNLANRVPFDDRVNHKAEMSDLNITLIQNYLKEVKSSLYEKSKTGDFVEVR